MRIVSKAELMRMPKGTLFADYRDNYWPDGPTMIFDSVAWSDEQSSDFYFTLFDGPDANDSGEQFDRQIGMAERGESYPVGLVPQREGLYEESSRYLVWEPEDVARIIRLLAGPPDRVTLAEERLRRAREALIGTGYFTPDQVGEDIAPRITELYSALTPEEESAS